MRTFPSGTGTHPIWPGAVPDAARRAARSLDRVTEVHGDHETSCGVAAAARATFLGECCGRLTARSGHTESDSAHPCRYALAAGDGWGSPDRTERRSETAYVIDGDLLALARAFDGEKAPSFQRPCLLLHHRSRGPNLPVGRWGRLLATRAVPRGALIVSPSF